MSGLPSGQRDGEGLARLGVTRADEHFLGSELADVAVVTQRPPAHDELKTTRGVHRGILHVPSSSESDSVGPAMDGGSL
jgi:hypothetical protein